MARDITLTASGPRATVLTVSEAPHIARAGLFAEDFDDAFWEPGGPAFATGALHGHPMASTEAAGSPMDTTEPAGHPLATSGPRS